MAKKSRVIESADGTTSHYTNIRFKDWELAFLAELEDFQPPHVKRRGTAPAVHRLIELAMAWDAILAKPLRDYLKAERMTPEDFAERAGVSAQSVRDVLTLSSRRPDHTTVAKIKAVLGA